MWLIEALKHNCELTVVTTGGWDLPALNDIYGTDVQPDEVHVRIAPFPRILRSQSAAALRRACYQHFAIRIASEYDIRINAYNPTDWGLPAIHCIADFGWYPALRKQFDPPPPGVIYRDSPIRRIYLKTAVAWGGRSERNVFKDDCFIANSHWTLNRLREHCGVERATVLYPPVWTEFPTVPWHVKENAFVMIGRIAPEKRLERAINILEKVRMRGFPVTLHLCGSITNDQYGRQITTLCRKHSNWITPEGFVAGVAKCEILARCRFGIQTRAAEPFGISVAEMVKAGAIVFAPNDGGQTEILDHPDLLFTDEDDAVCKICAVLQSVSLQETLRSHLATRAIAFTAQTFIRNSRTILGHALHLDLMQGSSWS